MNYKELGVFTPHTDCVKSVAIVAKVIKYTFLKELSSPCHHSAGRVEIQHSSFKVVRRVGRSAYTINIITRRYLELKG